MRRESVRIAALLLIGAWAAPVAAQEDVEEVIVTASLKRSSAAMTDAIDAEDLQPPQPPASVMTVRRRADYAVHPVEIVGDTVDEDECRKEILAMTRRAIELAGRGGVELATGGALVQPLTLANYTGLDFEKVRYPGPAKKVTFLVKVPLAGESDADAVLDRIEAYLKSVPAVGRAQIRQFGDLALSVVDPEQYRPAIIGRIAASAGPGLAPFGAGYGVTVTGLERPVQWAWAGKTDVNLYLPITLTLVPRP